MRPPRRDGRSRQPREPAMSGAFAVIVAFDLLAGRRGAFLALALENAAASVGLEAGCLRFDVLEPEGSESIMLYEIYTDPAAFDAHLRSAHFQSFDDATRHLVARKTVTVCDAAVHRKADA